MSRLAPSTSGRTSTGSTSGPPAIRCTPRGQRTCPGLSRTPQEWQTTLLPYRDYFRSKYGGVKYTRDRTPIAAVALADNAWLRQSNPFGFGDTRPDLNGWGPTTAYLVHEDGTWPTLMLW